MNATTTHEEISLETALKAVIVYDDLDFAVRVAAFLERAAMRATEVMNWDVKPWRLDVLKKASLAEAAIAEAADADLIVLALIENHPVSNDLLDWLENWGTRRRIRDAAVMLFCLNEEAAASPLWYRLEWFTKARGLAFLGGHSFWEEEDSLHFIQHIQPLRSLATPVAEPVESALRPPQHWGINE
jgi:hypothetical protein